MVYFTIVTGVATLVSLALQMAGVFPNHKKYLSHAMLLFLGMTLGLLLNITSSIHISLPETLSAREMLGLLLFSVTGILVFVLIILSVVTEDKQRRDTATRAASAVSGFLIFLLVFFVSTFFQGK